MFLGKWDCTIDKKWRLVIPAELNSQFKTAVLLKEGDDGCIQIKAHQRINEMDEPVSAFKVKIRVGKQKSQRRYFKKERVIIPRFFRNSTSFFYGRKVTIAGKGNYLELWPRP